ncbi:MAG: hypothetical protein ACYDAG_17970 [Chloroflexota bacterium]
MFLPQFYVESLGHYSYLIDADNEPVGFVVDPKRDIQDYLDAVRQQSPRITHIFKTHLNNDYLGPRGTPGRPTRTTRRTDRPWAFGTVGGTKHAGWWSASNE